MSNHTSTLHAPSEALPLGRPYGGVEASSAEPSQRRPFGMRFAQTCRSGAVSTIDFATISYDETRQIGVVTTPNGPVPLARHTNGQTSTVTHGDGKGGHDSDTDHRED
jgi:putative ATP-grasp target RiPP